MVELKIKGELLSKSNSRIFTYRGSRPRLIKSPNAIAYEKSSIWQIKSQLGRHRMFEEPIKLTVHVYYKTRRPDLDISLIQDILEKAFVYKNDRLVHEIHAYKYFDEDNPRVYVKIEPI